MEARAEQPAEEVKRLQRCINDLVSLLALPAIWSGGDRSQIVRTLLDVLLGMLRLDFVYARLNEPVGGVPIEMVRVAQSRTQTGWTQEIGEMLNHRLGPDPQKWVSLAWNPDGDGDMSIVPLRLGLQGEIGVIVAGARRPNFPGQTESLVLSVAANQAAIGLQEARLLGEQRRVANELDQRVAQRTAELSSANEELKKEVVERRRAEDERHAIEINFSQIVESFPGLVVTMNLAGQIDRFNHDVLEYFGKTPEELRNWATSDAVHPDDVPRVIAAFTNSIATGHPYSIEHRCRRADGVYRWFQVRALPVLDADGRATGWYVALTDIDDLKRAEDAIRASEQNLKLIINTIPTLAWSARPDGTAEFFNQHYLDYMGLSAEQAQDWGWVFAVHPDDRNALADWWNAILASGKPGGSEARLRRSDGEYRWFLFRANPLRDESGDIVNWYGTNTDIDDRKRAEALLAGEKRLLEMVAWGYSREIVLDALCRFVEHIASGSYCSVVLVDPNGTHLEYGTAPSLPASFIASIVGRPVSVDSGPSAMAACLNQQVIAADLRSETRWAGSAWCSMALAHGLQSCWSTPISSTAGKVLGAFAIYYDKPTTPTAFHQSLIEQFKHIASIAVERVQSDAALKRSEARKAAVFDSALDCIMTIDHEGRITEFNPAAERTFGYCRDDVVGKRLADVIIPPSLRERHRQGLARYLATGEAQVIGRRVELTAMRADGSEFPVELAITRIPLDGPPSFTGYLRDITERKQSEQQLRRSAAFLAQGEAISETGSFLWRVATDDITWSEQAYRIFGFDQGVPATIELICSRVHPDDLPLLHEMIGRARGEARDFEYEHRLLMPDQSVKYLHLVAHATRDHDGRLEYIGAIADVTQRRLAQEALDKVRSELTHVTRVMSLGALTASIAHEVNQPLSGIITNASTCLRMLAADPPNVDGARETARRTIRDGNRASDVITRLRALFAKKGAASESVDLNEATREVIALSWSELQRSRVALRTELADDLPPVIGDRVQLQQVVLNLLRNAADAMGHVDDRPRQLVIRTERDQDGRVRLTVQDAGVGIEPQALGRLFEAFYTTKIGGMGIGLSVSRSIIERHQGRLWATPNDGPGATFSFSIPCAAEGVAGANGSGVIPAPAVRDAERAVRRM